MRDVLDKNFVFYDTSLLRNLVRCGLNIAENSTLCAARYNDMCFKRVYVM